MSPVEHITSGAEKLGIGHSPAGYDRDVLLKLLWQGPVTVTFLKADGTERVMVCTLDRSLMPVFDRDILSPGLPNESIVTVWDLDNLHWKAIRLDRIMLVEQDRELTPNFEF